MLCNARVTIHDHLYGELHPLLNNVHFVQQFTDNADGTRRHALGGLYLSTHYVDAKWAFLKVTVTALGVDPSAQIILTCGDEIYSHGCVQVDTLASLIAEYAKSHPASPFCTIPLPEGFGEGFASAMGQNKGATLGSVPTSVPASMSVPFGIGEYFESLTSQKK